jgi:hypothetical protein
MEKSAKLLMIENCRAFSPPESLISQDLASNFWVCKPFTLTSRTQIGWLAGTSGKERVVPIG